MSLIKFRQTIFQNKFAVAAFSLFFLTTALSIGLTHNHSDDPFHAKEHKDCPVTVWAHTPFSTVLPLTFETFVLFLIGAVYFSLSRPFIPQFVSTRSPRGPPFLLA